MKRQLLTVSMIISATLLIGQGNVVVQVLNPASIADSYNNVYATDANMWGVADLTDPANAVTDTLALVHDGTAADSLGCSPLINGDEVTGKIAMVYRGTCPFSQKALNAQNAGAVGVVVISNSDDLAFIMLGGDLGPSVTIPVVMIAQSSGAIIRQVVDAEPVTAFIGNNYGAFPNNLSMDGYDMLVPSAASVPVWVAQDASEYQVELGGFIHNFGSDMQTNVRLRVRVTQDGSEVYNEVSSDQTILSGDSIFIQMPVFTQSSYSGEYAITYSAESDLTDEFPNDNSYTLPLSFGDLHSYVAVDAASNLPTTTTFVVPAEPTGPFRTCVAFADTNGSRLAVTGLHFAAQSPTDLAEPMDSVLTDLLVTTYAFLWTDDITNAFTPPTDAGLATLTNGSFNFPSNVQREMVFIPFEETIILEDNLRYLFCVETAETFVRHGWNETTDYTLNADYFIDPTSAVKNGQAWFNGFINLAGSPAIGVKMISVNTIGIDESSDRVELIPFPNPTSDRLTIPMRGFTGKATLQMYDVTGAKVAERNLSVGPNGMATIDLNGIGAGTYLFHMEFENGQRSDFRVVVTK